MDEREQLEEIASMAEELLNTMHEGIVLARGTSERLFELEQRVEALENDNLTY